MLLNRRLSEQCDGKEFLQGNGIMKETTKEILSELIARYFRITIADERGKKAYTRAYFTDEFNK